MAAEFKIKGYTRTPYPATAQVTPDIPAHVDGDLILIVSHCNGYNGQQYNVVSNPDSFAVDTLGNTSNQGHHIVLSLLADGSGKTAPTFQLGASLSIDHAVWVIVLENARATSYLDVLDISFISSGSGDTTITSPSGLSTSYDNQIVFYMFSVDFTSSFSREPSPLMNLMMLGPTIEMNGVQRTDTMMAWTAIDGAGSIPQTTTYTTYGDTGSWLVLSIRAADGAVTPPRVDPTTEPSTLVHGLNVRGSATYPFGGSAEDIADYLTTINSRTVVDSEVEDIVAAHPNGIYSALSTRFNVNAASNSVYTIGLGITSIDLTDELMAVTVSAQTNSDVAELTIENGVLFGFGSTNDAFKFLPISSRNSEPSPAIQHTVIFDMGITDFDLSVGYVSGTPTFDPATIDKLVIASNPIDGGRTEILWSELRIINNLVMTGSSTEDNAVNMQSFKDGVEQKFALTILDQQQGALGQYFIKQPLVSSGFFKDQNFSVEYVSARSGDSMQATVNDDTLGFELQNSSSINNGIFSCASTRHFFTTTGTGSHAWSNLTIINGLVTLAAGATYSGTATIVDSPELIHNGADLSAITITSSGCTGSQFIEISGADQAELQTALNNIANTITTGSVGYGININYIGGSTASISLNAPSGMNIDKTNFNSDTYSADLTIVVGSSGSSFGTLSTTNNATSLSVSNEKTITLNIVDETGSSVTGAEVTLLERGTTTEVDHDNSTASGSYTYTYTYSSDIDLDISVFKQGYIEFWDSTYTLSDSDQTISITLSSVAASQGT